MRRGLDSVGLYLVLAGVPARVIPYDFSLSNTSLAKADLLAQRSTVTSLTPGDLCLSSPLGNLPGLIPNKSLSP